MAVLGLIARELVLRVGVAARFYAMHLVMVDCNDKLPHESQLKVNVNIISYCMKHTTIRRTVQMKPLSYHKLFHITSKNKKERHNSRR